MPDDNFRDGPTGVYRDVGSGFAGRLQCKAEIWANLPISKRRQQDQQFIFSPETLSIAPEPIREKLQSISKIDGVFLAFDPTHHHNFVCAKKKGESGVDVDSDAVRLSALEFYGSINQSLVGEQGEGLLIYEKDDQDNETSRIKGVTAKAAHSMWINDGSLFSDYIVLPSEENLEPEDPVERTQRAFSPRWSYDIVNAPIKVQSANGQTVSSSANFHYPRQKANATSSPVDLISNNGVESSFKVSGSDFYRNINPGIHWRLVKRTSIFQGEDFWIEIRKSAKSSDIPDLGSAKFRMLNRFAHLDVNSIPQGASACQIQNLAMIETDENGTVQEDSKDKFDLARQRYFIIELGIGDLGKHNSDFRKTDAGHNYYIILAEKANPIFCHYDKQYLPCSTGSFDRNEHSLSSNPVLRKLSTYQWERSDTLMNQESLRITVRQHLGRIIITFSGHEDQPWIISRSDLIPTPGGQDPESSDEEDTEVEMQFRSVPMLIPAGKIAVMGGNYKCSFTFSPMTYVKRASFDMPQPLSVLGPVEQEEINLLLRDKGVSKLLDTDTYENSRQDLAAPKGRQGQKFQFNQDAEDYQETIDGDLRTTKAIKVQPDLVFRRGKAPDMQRRRNRDRQRTRTPHQISVRQRGDLVALGSDARFAVSMQADVNLQAGTYIFPAVPGDAPVEEGAAQAGATVGSVGGGNDVDQSWWLERCITPITTGFRLFVPASIEPAFNREKIDVSHHLLSYSDDWRADDWQSGQLTTIHHQAQVSFLLNAGMKFDDGKPNYSSYIHSLADKAFYIQISIYWEGGVMPRPSREKDRVVFTGLCYGGEVSFENNQRIMSCDLVDYSDILRDQKFKNSPFFDKMRDFNAINEILELASFRDGTNEQGEITDQSQPGSLIRRLADYEDGNNWITIVHNGETLFNREFALPGSYDILQEPFLRFQDGETYYDAIQRMAQLSGKVFFFDRLGVFHYDALPYEQELFGFQQGSGENEDQPPFDWDRLSKVNFVASPRDAEITDVQRQAFNSYTVRRNVKDVNNEIRVISTTPDGKLLVAGHTNFDSIFDPDKPGFLGYPKEFMQQDGIFGDEATVKWYVKNLTKMFIPPVVIRFEAVGRNLLRALDIVTFQGMGMREPQRLIIGSIKSEVKPAQNTWYQEFECYWLFPSTNIEWGETNDVALSLDGGIDQSNPV